MVRNILEKREEFVLRPKDRREQGASEDQKERSEWLKLRAW